MKECTLGLIYVCKALEFVFQTGWAVWTIFEGLQFINLIRNSSRSDHPAWDSRITIGVYVCMVLAVCQLIFHNFVFNCRFWMRLRCATCCQPTYNAFYYICGQCITRKVCRDRCFTVPTLIKWFVVYAPIFSVMFFTVQGWNER